MAETALTNDLGDQLELDDIAEDTEPTRLSEFICDAQNEFWGIFWDWPRDRGGKTMFLAEAIHRVGRKLYGTKAWKKVRGYFGPQQPWDVPPLDIATDADKWRVHELLYATDIEYLSKFEPTAKDAYGVPQFSEKDWNRATNDFCPVRFVELDYDEFEEKPKSFLNSDDRSKIITTIDAIASGIVQGHLISFAQRVGGGGLERIDPGHWNAPKEALQWRIAFGQFDLADPFRSDVRGPHQIYIDRETFNAFLPRLKTEPYSYYHEMLEEPRRQSRAHEKAKAVIKRWLKPLILGGPPRKKTDAYFEDAEKELAGEQIEFNLSTFRRARAELLLAFHNQASKMEPGTEKDKLLQSIDAWQKRGPRPESTRTHLARSL